MTNENIDNKIENIDKELLLKAYEQLEIQKKKQQEYRKKNKELMNTFSRRHYEKMKDDPEFLERRRKQKRESYQRNKDKIKEKREKDKREKDKLNNKE